jgi:hypothetical protein
MKPLFLRLSMFLFLLGCRVPVQDEIKDKLSGPFAVKSYKNNVFVVNSSFTGEFKDGNLQRYQLSTEGKLTLQQSVSTPRLSSDLAISPDGDLVVVAEQGKSASFTFFDLNPDQSILQDTAFKLDLGRTGSFKNLRFFKLKAKPDLLYLAANLDPRTRFTRTLIYEVDKKQRIAREWLRFPEALLGSKSPFFVSLGAYKIDLENEYLNLFPKLGTGRELQVYFPDVRRFLTGEATEPQGVQDFKLVSSWQVDLNKVVTGSPVSDAVFLTPYAFNDDGQIPEPYPPADSPIQPRWRLPAGSAGDIPDSECSKNVKPESFSFSKDSFLLVESRKLGDSDDGFYVDSKVYQFSGIQKLYTAGKELFSVPIEKRILKDSFARLVGVKKVFEEGSEFSNASYISQFSYINTPKGCFPFVHKVEFRTGGIGLEKAWFLYLKGTGLNQTGITSIPGNGFQASAVIGQHIVTFSYSDNSYKVFRFDGESVTELAQ